MIFNDFDFPEDGNFITLKKKEIKAKKSFDLVDPLTNAIKLKKFLEPKIFGQDMAIDAVVDSVKNKVVDSTNMPAHIFVFLGPSATGKTYFSQLIGDYFEEYSYLELNMQQFSNDKDGMNLYGSESNYSSSTPGRLTQAVKNHPKTVIVFDEFEKAHTNIQKKLLTIFSEGYLEDMNGWLKEEVNEWERDLNGYSPIKDDIPYNSSDEDHKKKISKIIRKVDFTQTIIVFTSNLGSTLYNNHEFLDCLKTDYDKAEVMIIQALQKEQKKEADSDVPAIIPEMLSRLSQGKIVLFNKLDFSDLFKIAKNSFNEKLIQFLKQNRHIKFESNDKLEEFLKCLLLKFTPFMDIRRIKSKFYENFSDKISDYLLDNEMTWKEIDFIDINISKDVQKFLEKEINPKIENKLLLKHFFRKNLTLDIKFDVRINRDIEIKEENDEMSLLTKGTIYCNIEQISIIKVNKIEDMLGDGAISFQVPDVSFDDIAGHDEVKNRLKEIANFLKYPEKLKKFKAKIPKGMLLYGIPGTGKTMLAKAFANYADLPFIETTANELMDLNSNGTSFMKEVFRKARDYSPSIIFIDEIDSFGSRSKGSGKVMINELLTQINGFSDDNNIEESVFIIAATNFKDDIDEAILRPGRIELHLEIPTLDIKGREYFINKILEKPCEENISISKLLMYSSGMTGAQLEKVSNESSLYALRTKISASRPFATP
ncbi:MAG: AAA family ATPase, partial [Erysipelotrichia bacterium]|nr:AAA family ATPase [Erysipelotrichia bacterium]